MQCKRHFSDGKLGLVCTMPLHGDVISGNICAEPRMKTPGPEGVCDASYPSKMVWEWRSLVQIIVRISSYCVHYYSLGKCLHLYDIYIQRTVCVCVCNFMTEFKSTIPRLPWCTCLWLCCQSLILSYWLCDIKQMT